MENHSKMHGKNESEKHIAKNTERHPKYTARGYYFGTFGLTF